MNSYTKKDMFTENSLYILDNCDLLIRDNCIIFNDVLYEKLDNEYRFFFNCHDYDYLENKEVIEQLNSLFKNNYHSY